MGRQGFPFDSGAGDQLGEQERNEAISHLARFTGLKPADIDAHNLRISQSVFCKELLKARRRSIGRFDARYQGIETSPANPGPSSDPSLSGVAPLHIHVQQLRPDRAWL